MSIASHSTNRWQHFLERISAPLIRRKPTRTFFKELEELLLAERASLLFTNEPATELIVKGAAGLPVETADLARIRVGEGIAGQVMESQEPLVVTDIEKSGFRSAEPERGYKTGSFISYPLVIGGRKIGVLFADKVGGASYDEVETLIDIIGPQIAASLERAGWQERANEFQLMSVTDPLTGLLNRRYLEERLNEELNRSRRYNYSMSFLMIDIDDFKNYNDVNGHQAGDQALQITAHGLRAELRLEDVACRTAVRVLHSATPNSVTKQPQLQNVSDARSPNLLTLCKNQPLGMVTISIGIPLFRGMSTQASP